jgi:hypothetical protein
MYMNSLTSEEWLRVLRDENPPLYSRVLLVLEETGEGAMRELHDNISDLEQERDYLREKVFELEEKLFVPKAKKPRASRNNQRSKS